MKKVLYIVPHLITAGPINQLYGLIKYLDRSKINASILTLSPEKAKSRWKAFEDIQIPVSTLGLTRFQSLFMAKRKVMEHIEHNMPEVIHSQGIRPDVLLSSLRFCGKKICTVRNFPQFDYSMTYGRIMGCLMIQTHMKALKKIDICIGVSQSVRNNLVNRYNIDNSDFIHNGVDTDTYNRVSSEGKRQLRKSLNLPMEAKIWVSSGHLSARKDPMAVIDSFTEKYCNDMQTILTFLGDGELDRLVRERVEGHKNILLMGRVNIVSDYLKAADFFVSTSHAEGLPNSVIEALACGLPVLLSDIEPHLEIMKMDTAIGKTYQLGNKRSLTEAFNYMEHTDYKIMSDSAYELVINELSAKVMSAKYQKLYLS